MSSFQHGQVFKVHIYGKQGGEKHATDERKSRKNSKRESHGNLQQPRAEPQEHENVDRAQPTWIVVSEQDNNHHPWHTTRTMII